MPLYALTLLFTVPPDEMIEPAAAYRDFARARRAAGTLRYAGELGESEGYIEVFEAADRMESEAVARANPLVEAGVVTWILRPYREVD